MAKLEKKDPLQVLLEFLYDIDPKSVRSVTIDSSLSDAFDVSSWGSPVKETIYSESTYNITIKVVNFGK